MASSQGGREDNGPGRYGGPGCCPLGDSIRGCCANMAIVVDQNRQLNVIFMRKQRSRA
jgi:hypothetical protein